MSVGPLQLLLIILIIVLLFGTKKLGNIGSDLGKAIRDFKKGMSGDDDEKKKNAESSETLKPDEPAAKSEKADASDSGNDKSSHDSSGR